MAQKGKAKQKQRDKSRDVEDFERVKRSEVASTDHIATSLSVTQEMAEELTQSLLPVYRERIFAARRSKERAEADRKRLAKHARRAA